MKKKKEIVLYVEEVDSVKQKKNDGPAQNGKEVSLVRDLIKKIIRRITRRITRRI